MAAAYDAVASAASPGVGSGSSSGAWNHTCSATGERLLLVGVLMRSSPVRQLTDVTYDGEPLIFLGATLVELGAADMRLEVWGMVAPPSGTNEVAITFSATTNWVAVSLSFTGVDQETPILPICCRAETGTNTVHGTFECQRDGSGGVTVGWIGGDASLSSGFSPTDGQTERAEVTCSGDFDLRMAAATETAAVSGDTQQVDWSSTGAVQAAVAFLFVRGAQTETPFVGNKVVHTNWQEHATDRKRFDPAHAFHYCVVEALHYRLRGLNAAGSSVGNQTIKPIVYADSLHNPTLLLAEGYDFVVEAGAAESWVRMPLKKRLLLPPGSYWLGTHSGDTSVASSARYAASGADAIRSGDDEFDDGTDPTFTSILVASNRSSIYADVEIDTGPTATVAHPTSGQAVRGVIALGVEAVSVSGIQTVQFKVDGADHGAPVADPPWTVELDTTGLSDGNHTVAAVATDLFGRTVTAPTVTFAVDNTIWELPDPGTMIALPPRVDVEIDFDNDPAQFQYADYVEGADPWAWYRMSEAAGSTAEDATANNRDGTYAGTTTKGQTGPITGEPADDAVAFGSSGALTRTGEAGWAQGATIVLWFLSKAKQSYAGWLWFFGLGSTYQLALLGSGANSLKLTYNQGKQSLMVANAGESKPGSVPETEWVQVAVRVLPKAEVKISQNAGDFKRTRRSRWSLEGVDEFSSDDRVSTGGSGTEETVDAHMVEVYVNGALASSFPHTSLDLNSIGTSWSFFSNGLTGDELAIYDYPVPAEEMVKQYEARAIPSPPADDWTSVTPYRREVWWKRGAEPDSDGVDPGEAVVVLDNSDRRFEPEHSGSPYYPNVIPRRKVRIVAGENDVTNPEFETATTGWTTGGTNTLTRDSVDVLVGFWSAKVAYSNSATLLDYAYTAPAAGGRTFSIWVRVPSNYDGGGVEIQAANYAGATDYDAARAAYDMTRKGQWQRLSRTVVLDAGDLVGSLRVANTGAAPTVGRTINAWGAQISEGGLQGYMPARTVVFQGYVESWDFEWPSAKRGLVAVHAIDKLAILAQTDFDSRVREQLPGARINRLLSAVAIPDGERAIDTGTEMLAAGTVTTNLLSHANQAARSELGRFFASGNGYATFHDRDHASQTARCAVPQAILGDGNPDTGELPVLAPRPDYDSQRIVGTVKGSRPGGEELSVSDATALRRYWPQTRPVATLLADEDALLRVMRAVLARYKDPRFRIREVSIDPRRHPLLYREVATREIGDRVEYRRRPDPETPASVKTYTTHVTRIENRIQFDERFSWRASYVLDAV